MAQELEVKQQMFTSPNGDNETVTVDKEETVQKESAGKLEKPRIPNLFEPPQARSVKVVLSVTPLEKEWIQYLAQEAGSNSVTEYMMHFVRQIMQDEMEQEILARNKGKRKRK